MATIEIEQELRNMICSDDVADFDLAVSLLLTRGLTPRDIMDLARGLLNDFPNNKVYSLKMDTDNNISREARILLVSDLWALHQKTDMPLYNMSAVKNGTDN
jgi:hypothetical protein